MKYAAIVLSAGSGSRMKSDIPKQYMDLLGKPVIYYSLQALEDSYVSDIILVTGDADRDYCRQEIVERYGFTKVRAIVAGGKERYHSVYQGLCAIRELGGADAVMIHDGARPVLSSDMLLRIREVMQKEEACIPGVPVKDTIKIADQEGYAVSTLDRRYVWIVQTPQAFLFDLIISSYEKVFADMQAKLSVPAITDDAMVVEYATEVPIRFVEGSYKNIKITTPEDLEVAALYLASEEKIKKC